ncbi:hypothetical protein [uncultured Shimia sp.]|uniref:hypothetical protein n=1 Tax=uncultured Shimia sp. TaxID=573152 RepID=UPI0026180337|nr:hypothetical protein [uncultured Shimia sp.]
MTPDKDPDGYLMRLAYPHGLRFTADGRYMFVADAGLPFVHVYARGAGWEGRRPPVANIRIMSDFDYLKGRYNTQEGGPKGLEIDAQNHLLLVTSEFQPLAAFDLQAIIGQIEAADQSGVATRNASRIRSTMKSMKRRVFGS